MNIKSTSYCHDKRLVWLTLMGSLRLAHVPCHCVAKHKSGYFVILCLSRGHQPILNPKPKHLFMCLVIHCVSREHRFKEWDYGSKYF